MIALDKIERILKKPVGNLNIEVTPDPLKVTIKNKAGETVQSLTFNIDGGFSFLKSSAPILGLGEGGPLPEKGVNWRTLPVQFDRNGFYEAMVPRWQSDAYGSRNPCP